MKTFLNYNFVLCITCYLICLEKCNTLELIPDCDGPNKLELNNFRFWNYWNGKPTFDTKVSLCHIVNNGRPYALNVTFEMNDSNASSIYSQCNQPLYKADAVEFFVTPQGSANVPEIYLEFELNPNGALFVATITNKCNYCSCIKHVYSNCSNPGILHYSASANTDLTHWKATIAVTFDFISESTLKQINDTQKGGVYRINFYRIDKLHGSTQYSAWSSFGQFINQYTIYTTETGFHTTGSKASKVICAPVIFMLLFHVITMWL